MTVAKAPVRVRLHSAQIRGEPGRGAILIRNGVIEITTEKAASAPVLLRQKVRARFEKAPLADAMQRLTDISGVSILLDPLDRRVDAGRCRLWRYAAEVNVHMVADIVTLRIANDCGRVRRHRPLRKPSRCSCASAARRLSGRTIWPLPAQRMAGRCAGQTVWRVPCRNCRKQALLRCHSAAAKACGYNNKPHAGLLLPTLPRFGYTAVRYRGPVREDHRWRCWKCMGW